VAADSIFTLRGTRAIATTVGPDRCVAAGGTTGTSVIVAAIDADAGAGRKRGSSLTTLANTSGAITATLNAEAHLTRIA
jgi:hypothetical protein